MNQITPAVHRLARRLMAWEAAQERASEMEAASRAVSKVRAPLAALAGAEGFRALLARAAALAKARDPSLGALRVTADGTLEGWDEIPLGAIEDDAAKGGAELLAELITLLIAFIGESLTLQLLRSQWPDAAWEHTEMIEKEAPR